MKILTKGALPSPTQKWWVDSVVTCTDCHTEVQLEANDEVRPVKDSWLGACQYIIWICPLCKTTNRFYS